jgi:3-oxoacyl-[acyl-carrier protein] reductase
MNVLITGCGSGIGRALVRAFEEQGHCVWATSLRLHQLAEVAVEDGWRDVRLRALDVTNFEDWDRVVQEMEGAHERPDVLCNVAGWLLPGDVVDTTPEVIDRHVDVNVKGVMFGTRRVGRVMVAAGSGHIVNIASLAGLAPVPGLSLYCATKFAVRGFSLSVGQELRRHGVYVTAVCPDAVQTPMLDLQVDHPEAALVFSGGRSLSVSEVCDAVLGPVLRDRPLELSLPRWRGALARVGGALPALSALSEPLLRRVGAANLRKAKARRDG